MAEPRRTFRSGRAGGRYYSVREIGSTMPTMMTLSQARAEHRAGRLLREGGWYRNTGETEAQIGRRLRHHRAAPSRAHASVTLQIDLTDMRKLAQSYGQAFETMRGGRLAISRTINFGMRKLRSDLKYKIKGWTGITNVTQVYDGFYPAWSTPATLTGVLKMTDKHRPISKADYGASWSRANPGATHRAWNTWQMAVGAFMNKKGVLRTRTTSSRYPLRTLWGPNFAREVERHRPEVQARVTAIGVVVQREALALLRLALSGSRK